MIMMKKGWEILEKKTNRIDHGKKAKIFYV